MHELDNSAERLGAVLGLFVRYSRPVVLEAKQALEKGEATPKQQRIMVELIEALTP